VQEYLIDLNATQAAIRAGYSQRTAQRIGSENLSKPLVGEAIAQAKAERAKRTEVTTDRVVEELARIAFASISDVVESGPDGLKLKQSSDLPHDAAAAVAQVRQTQGKNGHSLSVGMHDKLRALVLLQEHLASVASQRGGGKRRNLGTIVFVPKGTSIQTPEPPPAPYGADAEGGEDTEPPERT